MFSDDKVHRRDISVGVASTSNYEVLSGLTLGDQIALPGDQQLKDGMEVRPWRPIDAAAHRDSSRLGAVLCRVLTDFPRIGTAPLRAARSPADSSALIQTAQHQFKSGNYTSAIATLQSAISQNSSSGEAYYWLGRCYYEIRDYDNAITQAEKSVSLDPKNSLYHQRLGQAYGGKADRDRSFFLARKVKKEFQEAVRLNPANIAARRDLEDFCIDAPFIVGGSKDEASAQVDAIAAIDPVEGHVARGKYYQKASKNGSGRERIPARSGGKAKSYGTLS